MTTLAWLVGSDRNIIHRIRVKRQKEKVTQLPPHLLSTIFMRAYFVNFIKRAKDIIIVIIVNFYYYEFKFPGTLRSQDEIFSVVLSICDEKCFYFLRCVLKRKNKITKEFETISTEKLLRNPLERRKFFFFFYVNEFSRYRAKIWGRNIRIF